MSVHWRQAYRAYLFDLDGTLVDTAPDLNIALNHALEEIGCPPVSEDLTRHWVGHGARVMIDEALRHHRAPAEADVRDRALNRFLSHYGENLSACSRPYDGVVDTLEQLRGRGASLAVVTNKMARLSEPLLKELGLFEVFDLVVSGDTTSKPKPAPDPVLYCLEQLGLNAADCLYVGDSETDVLAARAAQVPVVCVRDGYNHGVDVASLHPDGVIDHFRELLV